MATTIESAKDKAASAAKDAKDAVVSSAEDVADRASDAANSAKRGARDLEEGLARGAEDLAANVGEKLRAVGVDTDRMVDVAKEQVTDLQRLIIDEIQERPLRALGLAAAVGLFVGFLSAR